MLEINFIKISSMYNDDSLAQEPEAEIGKGGLWWKQLQYRCGKPIHYSFDAHISTCAFIQLSIHHFLSFIHSSVSPSPSTFSCLNPSIFPSSHHAHLQDIQLHKDLRGSPHLWRPHSGSEGVHHGDRPSEDSDWGRYWGGWDNNVYINNNNNNNNKKIIKIIK